MSHEFDHKDTTDDDYGIYYWGKKAKTVKEQEYLFLLRERNRLKKMMTWKTGADLENKGKEKRFSTLFRGTEYKITEMKWNHWTKNNKSKANFFTF